jgi:hypothetical protein
MGVTFTLGPLKGGDGLFLELRKVFPFFLSLRSWSVGGDPMEGVCPLSLGESQREAKGA